jgi:hypothetical protein
MTFTADDVRRVRRGHPDLASLCANGLKPFGDRPADEPEIEQVNAAAQFIEAHCAHTVRTRNHSSYGWKHIAERFIGHYITNGAFIAAAALLGYKLKPSRPGSPNVDLAMRPATEALREFIKTGRLPEGA